jgi:hypothetical protein
LDREIKENHEKPQSVVSASWPKFEPVVFRIQVKLEFEIFTAASMKSTIICAVKPCSPVEAHRRFGENYGLHIRGLRVGKARTEQENLFAASLVYSSILRIEVTCSSETSMDLF